ncbi:hypothetical protein AB837_00026 [bacterium AB1]|nr:hypothetical protein AB837_00026 [bacterium AB1]
MVQTYLKQKNDTKPKKESAISLKTIFLIVSVLSAIFFFILYYQPDDEKPHEQNKMFDPRGRLKKPCEPNHAPKLDSDIFEIELVPNRGEKGHCVYGTFYYLLCHMINKTQNANARHQIKNILSQGPYQDSLLNTFVKLQNKDFENVDYSSMSQETKEFLKNDVEPDLGSLFLLLNQKIEYELLSQDPNQDPNIKLFFQLLDSMLNLKYITFQKIEKEDDDKEFAFFHNYNELYLKKYCDIVGYASFVGTHRDMAIGSGHYEGLSTMMGNKEFPMNSLILTRRTIVVQT